MAAETATLIWLREDLRLHDNTALFNACQQDGPVLALFMATPGQWAEHHRAPIQWDLIARRLAWIQPQLQQLGIPLLCIEVDDFTAQQQALMQLVAQFNIRTVHANRQYEWNEAQRDQGIAAALEAEGVEWHCHHDACILPPGSLTTKQGGAFKVFTPFRNAWLQRLRQTGAPPLSAPAPRYWPGELAASWQALGLQPSPQTAWQYPRRDSSQWPADDDAILARLNGFLAQRAIAYKQRRDFPVIDGTSSLSPYLATGMLSPRQCLAALLAEHPEPWDQPDGGAFCWLNELVWREFYRHVLHCFPRVSRGQAFQPYTAAVPWRWDRDRLVRWQQGKTGFPIVDAAMRQLAVTGWMHNRLRMIVASFLTKDLHLHWQLGEQWFSEQLIDGDLAANNGGWQWAASTGTDAQPYFRIFNPTTQGKRFDPDGAFIRCWVEELADVPDKYLHQPHLWPGTPAEYPIPMVDHDQARKQAVTLFQQAKLAWEERSVHIET